MYSIVMVAAMTAAPEAPDFFFNKGGGCHGCNGGCQGWTAGSGCCGGGWAYGGCRGSGWGCHGSMSAGCYGGGCNGCNGGGCHGMFGGGCFFGGGGCFFGHKSGGGCCGGYAAPYYTGCGGYAVPGASQLGTPPMGIPPMGTTPKVGFEGLPSTGVPEAVATLPANRAQVVVRVPADAKLYADDQVTSLTGPERVFMTPELSTGRDAQYTLKVEYTAAGATKSDTKQVVVRGGHRTIIEFAVPSAAEKTTSPVTVTLPEKAKLFVDGVAAASTAGKHSFNTPELPKGKPFVYEFRAEVEKDGKTETVSQKVTFKAGEPIVVDFTDEVAVRTALK